MPKCDYLKAEYKHGYTITVGRTHADGSVRLAREIPYGSPAWKERYNRRNSARLLCGQAESRNSVLERLGLKHMPACLPVCGRTCLRQAKRGRQARPGRRRQVHGLASCHVTVLQGDFVANQCTLVRLIREATALG